MRALFPLLFQKVITFKGPIWSFAEGIYLSQIYDEDFGAFHRDDLSDVLVDVTALTKCIYIDNPISDDFQGYASSMATKLKFVLNNFSNQVSVVLPFAFLINPERKKTIQEVVRIEAVANTHEFKKMTYRFKTGVDRQTIFDFFAIVSRVCDQNPTILFTLERFNSCLARSTQFDKIVDLSISLESLISSRTEIVYKFALNNSFIATSSAAGRARAFTILKHLYDARSGIVHGDVNSKDTQKALRFVEDNWNEIIEIARASIIYLLIFKYENETGNWDEHLKALVFGTETRIVD